MNVYNTPRELGLRVLYYLRESYPKCCSLDRLIYLDYLGMYLKDAKLDYPSLHPEYLYRNIEILEKKSNMSKGILIMMSKGLIEVGVGKGLVYKSNANTGWFLDYIENEYSEKLTQNAALVVEKFRQISDDELKEFIEEITEVFI